MALHAPSGFVLECCQPGSRRCIRRLGAVETLLTGHENRQFTEDRLYDEDERDAKRSNVFSSLNMSRQTGSVLTGAAVGIGLVVAGHSVSSITDRLRAKLPSAA
jgi:hypothetical protein